MSEETIRGKLSEAKGLAVASDDVDIDEAIVLFEQATEDLEKAREVM